MESITEEESERLYMASFIKFGRDADYTSRLPPTRIFMFPDIFEQAWGWDRLLPKDHGPMPLYLDYLKEYHRRNVVNYVADGKSKPEHWPLKARPVDDDARCSRNGKDALTDAARFCLDMERQFMSVWNNQPVRNVKLLSDMIQDRASSIIRVGREFSEPAAASLVCIANEAALAFELLRRGAKATDEEINVCNCIRHCALNLMNMEGPNSDVSAAAMVGVAKEAKNMREWMSRERKPFVYYSHPLFHDMGLCDKIRTVTFGVMKYILSNSTGINKPFVAMRFRQIKNKGKSQKTASKTSNEFVQKGKKVTFGKLSVEQVSSVQNKASDCTLSTAQNHLNSIAAEYNPNIVNQADMLTPASGPRVPKQPALLDESSLLDVTS